MHQPIQPQKPNIDSKNHIFSGAERPSVNLYYLICNLHYRTHYIHLFTILKISYWMSGSMEMFLIVTYIKKQVVLILNVVKNYVVFILVSAQFVTVIWWQWHKLTCYIFWQRHLVTWRFCDTDIYWQKHLVTEVDTNINILIPYSVTLDLSTYSKRGTDVAMVRCSI